MHTLERKKRTREEGSRGMRPEIVKGRVLAAINLATLARKTCSLSKSGWDFRFDALLSCMDDCLGARSISKSDMLGLLLNGSALSRLLPSDHRLAVDWAGEASALIDGIGVAVPIFIRGGGCILTKDDQKYYRESFEGI